MVSRCTGSREQGLLSQGGHRIQLFHHLLPFSGDSRKTLSVERREGGRGRRGRRKGEERERKGEERGRGSCTKILQIVLGPYIIKFRVVIGHETTVALFPIHVTGAELSTGVGVGGHYNHSRSLHLLCRSLQTWIQFKGQEEGTEVVHLQGVGSHMILM